MTNEEKIKKIEQWQHCGYVHPLTCGTNSNHPVLIGFVNGQGEVNLKCTVCNYVQTWIPIPYDMDIEEMNPWRDLKKDDKKH